MQNDPKGVFHSIRALLSEYFKQEEVTETVIETPAETPVAEPVAEPAPETPAEPVVVEAAETPKVDESAAKIAELEARLEAVTVQFNELKDATAKAIKEGVEKMATALTQTIDVVEAKLSEPSGEPIQTPPNNFRATGKEDKRSEWIAAFQNKAKTN